MKIAARVSKKNFTTWNKHHWENYSRETCRSLFTNYKSTVRLNNNSRDLDKKNDKTTYALKSEGLHIYFSTFQIALSILSEKMISNEISRQIERATTNTT